MAAARKILMACQETSYGVPKTTPVLGTNKCYYRLDRDGAFTGKSERAQIPIPYGGGFDVEADTAPGVVSSSGGFAFRLYPGLWSKLLLQWACVFINSGRTLPWVTTDAAGVLPIGDTPTLSLYEATLKEDGATWARERWAAVKCDTWELAGNDQDRTLTLSGTWSAQKVVPNEWEAGTAPDATEFPFPTDAQYPYGPYLFSHLATASGGVTIGAAGSPLATDERKNAIQSFVIRGTNNYTKKWYASDFLQRNEFTSRAITAEFVLRRKWTPDDRARWRTMVPMDVVVTIDQGTRSGYTGTNSIQLDLHDNNLIRPWEPTDGADPTQKLTIANRWSATDGTDFSVSFTDATPV
jgi:hypothetical protein